MICVRVTRGGFPSVGALGQKWHLVEETIFSLHWILLEVISLAGLHVFMDVPFVPYVTLLRENSL